MLLLFLFLVLFGVFFLGGIVSTSANAVQGQKLDVHEKLECATS